MTLEEDFQWRTFALFLRELPEMKERAELYLFLRSGGFDHHLIEGSLWDQKVVVMFTDAIKAIRK